MRDASDSVLAAMLVLVVTVGCGSAEDDSPADSSEIAIETALADDRVPDEWLADGNTVATLAGAGHWEVRHHLDRPRPDAEWTSVTCAVPRSGPIDAIEWWVSADGREIVAMSPRWGDVTCLSAGEGSGPSEGRAQTISADPAEVRDLSVG